MKVQYDYLQSSSPPFTDRAAAGRYHYWGQDRIRPAIPQEKIPDCASIPHDENSRGGVILEMSNDQGSPFSAVDPFCQIHPRKPLLPQNSIGVAFCGKEGVLTVTATTGEIPTAQSTGKTSPASCFCQKNSLAQPEITKTTERAQSFPSIKQIYAPKKAGELPPKDPKRIDRDLSGRQPKMIASQWTSSSSAATFYSYQNHHTFAYTSFTPYSIARESQLRNTVDFHIGNEVRTLVDGQRTPRQNGECRNQFSLTSHQIIYRPERFEDQNVDFLLLTLQ